MEITDMRVNIINSNSGVKAIGSFSLDGLIAIRGIRVMEDKSGREFVAFPAREKSNGEYEDIVFPLNKEMYHKVTEAVLEEYKKQQEMKQTADNVEKASRSKGKEKDDTPLVEEKAQETTRRGKHR